MNNMVQWLKAVHAPFLGVIVVTILLTGVLADVWARHLVGSAGQEIEQEIASNLKLTDITATRADMSPVAREVLNKKFHDANLEAEHHFQMTRLLNQYGMLQLVMAIMAGGAAAVCLFFLTQTGLQNADIHLKMTFAALAVTAAAFVAEPLMFKLDDNIKENITLYKLAMHTSDEIYTYVHTVGKHDADLKTFLDQADASLENSRNIAFVFDVTQTPTLGTFSSVLKADQQDTPK